MLIENDTNTNGFNQWFYFSIRGAKRSIKYKFHIVNLVNLSSYLEKAFFVFQTWNEADLFFNGEMQTNWKWMVSN